MKEKSFITLTPDKEWEVEYGWERVVAWFINLTVGQVLMSAYRKDNPRVYQDGNEAYPKNFWWSISSINATTFNRWYTANNMSVKKSTTDNLEMCSAKMP